MLRSVEPAGGSGFEFQFAASPWSKLLGRTENAGSCKLTTTWVTRHRSGQARASKISLQQFQGACRHLSRWRDCASRAWHACRLARLSLPVKCLCGLAMESSKPLLLCNSQATLKLHFIASAEGRRPKGGMSRIVPHGEKLLRRFSSHPHSALHAQPKHAALP